MRHLQKISFWPKIYVIIERDWIFLSDRKFRSNKKNSAIHFFSAINFLLTDIFSLTKNFFLTANSFLTEKFCQRNNKNTMIKKICDYEDWIIMSDRNFCLSCAWLILNKSWSLRSLLITKLTKKRVIFVKNFLWRYQVSKFFCEPSSQVRILFAPLTPRPPRSSAQGRDIKKLSSRTKYNHKRGLYAKFDQIWASSSRYRDAPLKKWLGIF